MATSRDLGSNLPTPLIQSSERKFIDGNIEVKKLEAEEELHCNTETWNIVTMAFFCKFVLMPGYIDALSIILPTYNQQVKYRNTS